MKRVLVNGAAGKMGSEVLKAVNEQNDMEIAAGVDVLMQSDINGIKLYNDLDEAIRAENPDVVVDFTEPGAVLQNIKSCIKHKVRVVVGTTGLTKNDFTDLEIELSEWAALIAPNFAIGAILMMSFAKQAAEYFSDIEIIEYHHQQKKDAPSGTALKTADMINQVWEQKGIKKMQEAENDARGFRSNGLNIHSVRLPGYVAHQEVILSLAGQNLTIRHDSTHRSSFMPGVLLAIRKIDQLQGIVYGLEHIL